MLNNVAEKCQLSIIVPVYNVEKYIHACMESIFRQGLDDKVFEVIIVNDGTQDRSMEVIQDIISQHDNITVINQENLSLSVARNNGIAVAKGEYILMPDSDDLLIDNSLSILLEKALESKADLVVADFLEMTDEEIKRLDNVAQKYLKVKEKTGEQMFLEDLNPRQCYVWRTLYRRAFIQENNLTFIPGVCYQDVPFTHECYLRAKKCLRVSRLLNVYRKGHASATYSFNKKKAHDLITVIAGTWKLRKIEGLSPAVLLKLEDDVFTSFSLLIYFMLYGMKDAKERQEVFQDLNNTVPDLNFSNGRKQKMTWFLYKHSPKLYFALRLFIKSWTPKPNFE
jgi:glycosyltransferase involved in cell wall biosynthesis